jgi:hypothetical protein
MIVDPIMTVIANTNQRPNPIPATLAIGIPFHHSSLILNITLCGVRADLSIQIYDTAA